MIIETVTFNMLYLMHSVINSFNSFFIEKKKKIKKIEKENKGHETCISEISLPLAITPSLWNWKIKGLYYLRTWGDNLASQSLKGGYNGIDRNIFDYVNVFFVVFKFVTFIFITIIEGCSSKSSNICRLVGFVGNYTNYIVFLFASAIVFSIIFTMYF